MNIEQTLDEHRDRLMAIQGVTGVGIGSKNGKPAIVIMVTELTHELKKSLPDSISGSPVVVEQSGDINAF